MKVTINDIAKMAGVSKATVSRVLNDSKPVSEEIRQKVLDVIEKTEYQPSSVARQFDNAKDQAHWCAHSRCVQSCIFKNH